MAKFPLDATSARGTIIIGSLDGIRLTERSSLIEKSEVFRKAVFLWKFPEFELDVPTEVYPRSAKTLALR